MYDHFAQVFFCLDISLYRNITMFLAFSRNAFNIRTVDGFSKNCAEATPLNKHVHEENVR